MCLPRFLDPLPTYRKLREANAFGRATWRQEGVLRFVGSDGAPWIVPDGFETDFASVPRLPLAYWLTGDTAHMSAVLHDYLCRNRLLPWGEAAEVFLDAMRAEGVTPWRRRLMYWAVRYLGGYEDKKTQT